MAEVAALVANGTLEGTTAVWTEGMDEWRPLAAVATQYGLPAVSISTPRSVSGADRGDLMVVYDTGDGTPSDELPAAELGAKVTAGEVAPETRLWSSGLDDWAPYENCSWVFGLSSRELLYDAGGGHFTPARSGMSPTKIATQLVCCKTYYNRL
jgi:hypothetical protein